MNSHSTASTRMPIVFIGHGSPENVLNENAWTQSLTSLGKKIKKPKAIVCVSAHWTSSQFKITSSAQPELIYDFFGFPQPLYSIKYSCQGDPELADQVQNLLKDFNAVSDPVRGFDHGVWTPLFHMYPKADIPIVQISLNAKFKTSDYLKIGLALQPLREQGILIIGSGNIVHNLRELQTITTEPFNWAIQFDSIVKNAVVSKQNEKLCQFDYDTKDIFEHCHPIPDHYWPLLICAGASTNQDHVSFPYEGFQYGSISMRNILWE